MLPRRRLARMVEKNAEEVRALLSGRMPRFVLGGDLGSADVPVFVFHDVTPERFGAQLDYLAANDYETVHADAIAERGGTRRVMLTFDDATWTFWSYAFPLLVRHGARAVLFAIPGIVPEDDTRHPTLGEVSAGRATPDDLARRGERQPLCTRRELAEMHASGLVDVQSHSMTHQRVPISPRVVDYLHPGFDADAYGNVRVPVSVLDDPRAPARPLRLGAPVFESASRLAGRRRFVESRELVEALAAAAAREPGIFERAGWRATLDEILARWPAARRGALEPDAEMEAAIRHELVASKAALEVMLPGKEVAHLCYPWFQGSPLADRLAAEAGYRATYYGLLPGPPPEGTALRTVARVSEAYLMRLPGEGRVSLASIWGKKLRH